MARDKETDKRKRNPIFPDEQIGEILSAHLGTADTGPAEDLEQYRVVPYIEFEDLMQMQERLSESTTPIKKPLLNELSQLIIRIEQLAEEMSFLIQRHIGSSYLVFCEIDHEIHHTTVTDIVARFLGFRDFLNQELPALKKDGLLVNVGLHLEYVNESSRIDTEAEITGPDKKLFQVIHLSSGSDTDNIRYSTFHHEDADAETLRTIFGMDIEKSAQHIPQKRLPYAQRSLAYLFQARRNPNVAHLLFRKVARTLESNEAVQALGDLFIDMGQFQEELFNFCHTQENVRQAGDYFKQVQVRDGDAIAQAKMVNTLRNLNSFDQAYELSQKLIEEEIDHVSEATQRIIWYYHSILQNDRGNYQEGRSYLNKTYQALQQASAKLVHDDLIAFFLRRHWLNSKIIRTWQRYQRK